MADTFINKNNAQGLAVDGVGFFAETNRKENSNSNDPTDLEEEFQKAKRRHSNGAITIGTNGPNSLTFRE